MTPTLKGRLQTRWIMVWTIGLAWTLFIGPLLPLAGPRFTVYHTGITALVLVSVVGTAWEFLYHGLQQLRWDKDWPTALGLFLGVTEGFAVYQLLQRGLPWETFAVTPGPFVWQFGTVWLSIWVFTNGPIRVLFPRWRFAGGQFW